MRVSDVMRKDVDFVTTDATIEDASQLIFGRGINGVPVCKGRKVVGFITERDILAKFYPTMQEYVEDPFRTGDFEAMEQKVSEVLSLTTDKIMSKNPITITADIPLLKAQSLMFVRKVGRLPVVDKRGNLIGIISKGDVFRAIVGERLPLGDEEEFYDWVAHYYDDVYDWRKRLKEELPGLTQLFRKEKVKTILDVASSTGEHSLALAKRGFRVFGIEASSLMHKFAQEKRSKLLEDQKERVRFLEGDYKKLLKGLPEVIDAGIFLGNALPHVIYTDKQIIQDVLKVLHPKRSIMIFQVCNFEKVFKAKGGLRDFTLIKASHVYKVPHAFLTFYTKDKRKTVVVSRAVFVFIGGKWISQGIRSTPVVYVGQKEISALLKKGGFGNLKFYGSPFYGPLFKESFKPLEHDWLTVVAKR